MGGTGAARGWPWCQYEHAAGTRKRRFGRTGNFEADADAKVEEALRAVDVHIRDPNLLHRADLARVLLVARHADLDRRFPGDVTRDGVERVELARVRVPQAGVRVGRVGALFDAGVEQVVKVEVLVLCKRSSSASVSDEGDGKRMHVHQTCRRQTGVPYHP